MHLSPAVLRAVRVLAGMLAILCLAPALAQADSATVTFTDAAGKADPVVGVGRTMTVSGNVSSPTNLYVLVRPAGGAPCAPSEASDTARNIYFGSFSGDTMGESNGNTNVEGNFTRKKTGNWSTAGTFLYCIWLAPTRDTPVVPISQTITFRKPNGTVSATLTPNVPGVEQSTAITLTGSSEAPSRVYASAKPGAAPCAASYSAENGASILREQDVNGAFSLPADYTPKVGGPHRLCLYLAKSSDDPDPIAVQAIPFDVVQPCVVPAITSGSDLASAQTALAGAGCALGAQTLQPTGKVPRGTVIGTAVAAGTKLGPGAAVDVSISDGKACRVPTSNAGQRLSKVRAKLAAVGCTVGTVKRVKSKRKKGTLVRFTPKSGTVLAPRATVNIQVSRGRR